MAFCVNIFCVPIFKFFDLINLPILGCKGTNTVEKENEADFVEGVVCNETDLKENEMKQFELGDGKVLLVKQNGKFSAVGECRKRRRLY